MPNKTSKLLMFVLTVLFFISFVVVVVSAIIFTLRKCCEQIIRGLNCALSCMLL